MTQQVTGYLSDHDISILGYLVLLYRASLNLLQSSVEQFEKAPL